MERDRPAVCLLLKGATKETKGFERDSGMSWVSRMRILFVSSLLAMQAGAAGGQTRPGIRPFVTPPEDCYVSDPVETENIYYFLRVQVLALSLAQRGARANSAMLQTKGGAPLDEMDKAIAGMRQERILNTCASFVVSYYVDSKIPGMAKTAKFLAHAYDQFGEMSNQMLGISLQKSLSGATGPSPQLQFSRLLEKRQETLRNMTDALKVCLELLIDKRRTDTEGKPDHLILNKAEVTDLLDYIYVRFPTLKGNHGGEGPGDFTEQAASIQAFLGSGYRPSDVP